MTDNLCFEILTDGASFVHFAILFAVSNLLLHIIAIVRD